MKEPISLRFSLEEVLMLLHSLDAVDYSKTEALQKQKDELKGKLEELRKVLGGEIQ